MMKSCSNCDSAWILAISIAFTLSTSCAAQSLDRQAPSIIGYSENIIFEDQDTFEINCVATGNPQPLYTWSMNNSVIVANQTDGMYSKQQGSNADVGYYECRASNDWGTSMSGQILVQRSDIDKIPNALQSRSVRTGDQAMFACRGSPASVPPATYKWQRSQSEESTDFSDIILSSRVQINYATGALYYANTLSSDVSSSEPLILCHASTSYTSQRGSYYRFTLTTPPVATPPSVSLAFQDPSIGIPNVVTVVLGQSVRLRCFFYGMPTPTIQWSRDDVAGTLNGTTDYGTSYVIDVIQRSHDGVTYRCTGSGTSNTAATFQLVVEEKPSFSDNGTGPADVNGTVGHSASFICAPNAVPAATIEWFVNGQQLDLDSLPPRFVLSDDHTNLTVTSLCINCTDRSSDFMVVTCRATNIHGSAIDQGYLNLILPTNITTPITDRSVPEGQSTTFSCTATSDQLTPINFTWLFNGSAVNLQSGDIDANCEPNSCDLTISSVATRHHGDYVCFASNSYSSSQSTATLTVLPPIYVFSVAEIWWVFLLIGLLLLLLLVVLLCYCYCKDNDGDSYPVDEIETKHGNDPKRDLRDADFQNFEAPRMSGSGYQVWTVGNDASFGSKLSGSIHDSHVNYDQDVMTKPWIAPQPPPPPAFTSVVPQTGYARRDSSSSSDSAFDMPRAAASAGPVPPQRNSRPVTPRSSAGFSYAAQGQPQWPADAYQHGWSTAQPQVARADWRSADPVYFLDPPVAGPRSSGYMDQRYPSYPGALPQYAAAGGVGAYPTDRRDDVFPAQQQQPLHPAVGVHQHTASESSV